MLTKKILFINGSFFPSQIGGPDVSCFNLTRGLVELGYKVKVLTFYSSLQQADIEKYNIIPDKISIIEGVEVIFFKFKVFKIMSKFFFKFKKIYSDYEIIYLNSIFFYINLPIILFTKTKIVVAPRGELNEGAFSNKKIKKKIFLFIYNQFFLNKIYKFHFTTNSEFLDAKKYLSSIKKYTILPNFIFEKKKNLPKKNLSKNFLYLGRLDPKKKIDTLIKIFCSIPPDIKKKHKLIIVGSGKIKYLRYLQKLTKEANGEEDIIFLGKLYKEDKNNIILNSKFLILISKSENFGNVILESILLGTPVIFTENLPWDFSLLTYGFIAKNNESSIKSCIINAININDTEYFKYSSNAITYSNNFSFENYIDDLKLLFDE